MKNGFVVKVIVALCGSLAFILAFNFLPVWFTTAIATLVSVLIFYELSIAAGLIKSLPLRITGFTISALIPWLFYFEVKSYWLFIIIFLSTLIAFLSLIIRRQFDDFDEIVKLIFCESIFQISISLMTPLIKADSGVAIIIMAYITAWGTDAIAQLVGRKIGKNHFVPDISPNKTAEGSISGIIGNTVVIAIYALVLKLMHYNIPAAALIICGFIAGIAGEIGDLFFSYIKRSVGIKDFGSFIKGHGGVLDRFDSVVFALPIWYVFINNFSITK